MKIRDLSRLCLLLVFSVCVFVCSIQAQELTTFILVRHAEKAQDHPKDPNLNTVGKERAIRLAKFFENQKIDHIFSTAYKRTEQTVQPIAEKKNLRVINYKPFENELLERWLEDYKGKTILVCGHSNTIPKYVNHLSGSTLPDLEEQEYDKIFTVTIDEMGSGKVLILTDSQ